MPVSNPSYFPPSRTGDIIVGITAGKNYNGARAFLAGQSAGNNSTLSDFIVIGDLAASNNLTDPQLNGTTVIGSQALENLISSGTAGTGGNTVYGYQAMQNTAYGGQNVAIGSLAMQNATGAFGSTVAYNVVIGYGAGQSYGTSFDMQQCVIIGSNAGNHSPTNNNNVVIGCNAFQNGSNGGNNSVSSSVIIGYACAGNGTVSGSGVFIGGGLDGPGGGYSVVIGNSAKLSGTNVVSIGDSTVENGNYSVIVGDHASGGYGSNNVVLGSGAGYNNGTFSNTLLIQAWNYPNTTSPQTLIYGVFAQQGTTPGPTNGPTGLVLGNSSGTTQQIPGNSAVNTVSIVNGNPGANGANPNGYLYADSVHGLTWVGTSGTKTIIAPM